jgi:hypothetical protein
MFRSELAIFRCEHREPLIQVAICYRVRSQRCHFPLSIAKSEMLFLYVSTTKEDYMYLKA